MAEKKKKRETFVTPVGVAVWPKLAKADTKFKEEGEFSIKLRLPADKAAALIERIKAHEPDAKEKLAAFVRDQAKKGKQAKVKGAPMNLPYSSVVDDQGEETGEVEFKFTAKASGKTKEGKPWRKHFVPTFDRFGKPLLKARTDEDTGEIVVEGTEPRGGSKVVVSYSVSTYCTPAVWGISLRLEAVLVKELVAGGERSAASFGFEVDEEEPGDDGEDAEDTTEDSGGGGADTPDF